MEYTEYTLTSTVNQPTVYDFQKWLEVQAQEHDKINRENVHKTFDNKNTLGHNKNNISRANNNTDNRNNNDTNHFPTNALNNWKKISLNSNCPANHDSQPLFPPRKDTHQPNRACEKCKGSHVLATSFEYQKCSPVHRYEIASKNNQSLLELFK